MERHLLSIVVFLPVAGALALLLAGRFSPGGQRLQRAIACLTATLTLAASVPLWFQFAPRGAEWQFVERLDILPALGANYVVGIDGLSLLLILLTTALTFVAVLAPWAPVTTRVKDFYVGVLLLEAGIVGVYVALDLALFSLCWLLAAASMCVLIGVAGERTRATGRLSLCVVQIVIVPCAFIAAGVVGLYIEGHALTGVRSFDIRAFQHLALPSAVQRWVFLAFFAAFAAASLGVFRWWVTIAANGRAVAAPVLLAAVFLKLSTFGLLRLNLPLLPDASRVFAPAVLALCAIGVVYGAVAALAQSNWARVLAYASLSHICFSTLGAFALTPDGLTGSAIHQINHGVSIAALFLLGGLVAARGSGRDVIDADRGAIAEYGGLLNAMPIVAAVWLLMTLSLAGIPKLNGFVGARLILEGMWPASRVWSIVAAGGMALSGVALVWLFSRTMLGELKSPAGAAVKDLRPGEAIVFLPLAIFVVWVGVSPAAVLARVETSVARVVLRVSPQYAPLVVDCLTQPVPTPAETGLPAGMVLMAPCADGESPPASPKP